MTQQHLYEWIAHPELLNRDTLYELRTLLARYPYFQTVRLLYLKNLFLLHDITFGEELRRAALYIADRKVLFYLIEGERFTITPSEGKEKSSDLLGLDRTLSLIDAFLAGQPEEEQKDITQLPMDITTDYTSYLLTETEEAVPVEEIPSLKGQDLIDTFWKTIQMNLFFLHKRGPMNRSRKKKSRNRKTRVILPRHWQKYTLNNKDIQRLLKLLKN